MNKQNSAHSQSTVKSTLTWVFFFSGFAALIYQVIWQRALTLYYGVGTISMTLIVSIYMVGLGFGSLIFQFSCTNTRINSGVDTIELTQRNRFNGFQHNPFIINK